MCGWRVFEQALNKLGLKPGMKVLLINKPGNYYDLIRFDIKKQLCAIEDIPDLVHLFVTSIKELEKEMKRLNKICDKNSKLIIWVSWYKKSAGIFTDVTEDVIRHYALKNNLVDIKVCAVSDLWSGLKLVVPLEKRK